MSFLTQTRTLTSAFVVSFITLLLRFLLCIDYTFDVFWVSRSFFWVMAQVPLCIPLSFWWNEAAATFWKRKILSACLMGENCPERRITIIIYFSLRCSFTDLRWKIRFVRSGSNCAIHFSTRRLWHFWIKRFPLSMVEGAVHLWRYCTKAWRNNRSFSFHRHLNIFLIFFKLIEW